MVIAGVALIIVGFIMMAVGTSFCLDISDRLTDILVGGGIVIVVIGIFCLALFVEESNENNKQACESIGGKYVVIDKEETMILIEGVMTPTEVDVYGCVK